MVLSKPFLLFLAGNILLVIGHLTIRGVIVRQMRTMQEQERTLQELKNKKNTLILEYEQLKDPLKLSAYAQKELGMSKVRLSRIHHLRTCDAVSAT